jgi:hypothetical protein
MRFQMLCWPWNKSESSDTDNNKRSFSNEAFAKDDDLMKPTSSIKIDDETFKKILVLTVFYLRNFTSELKKSGALHVTPIQAKK